jgi:hypothetical protein
MFEPFGPKIFISQKWRLALEKYHSPASLGCLGNNPHYCCWPTGEKLGPSSSALPRHPKNSLTKGKARTGVGYKLTTRGRTLTPPPSGVKSWPTKVNTIYFPPLHCSLGVCVHPLGANEVTVYPMGFEFTFPDEQLLKNWSLVKMVPNTIG